MCFAMIIQFEIVFGPTHFEVLTGKQKAIRNFAFDERPNVRIQNRILVDY